MRGVAPAAEKQVGRAVGAACRLAAMAGGLLLVSAAAVTVVSVTGRALTGVGLGPVRGDFELVEMGCAIAVFAFLPWCQFHRAHVTVDILAERLPPRIHAALGLAGDAALALCAGVIFWRFWLGTMEKVPFGSEAVRAALGMGPKPFFAETTYELQIPVWIPYSLALAGAGLFFLTCLYTCWRSLNWTLRGGEPARP